MGENRGDAYGEIKNCEGDLFFCEGVWSGCSQILRCTQDDTDNK